MRTADQTQADVNAYALFRAKQREQPRTRGSWRRNKYLLELASGALELGTRAKSRGSYPQHLIDNCKKMRARTTTPGVAVGGATYSYAECKLSDLRIIADDINYRWTK